MNNLHKTYIYVTKPMIAYTRRFTCTKAGINVASIKDKAIRQILKIARSNTLNVQSFFIAVLSMRVK